MVVLGGLAVSYERGTPAPQVDGYATILTCVRGLQPLQLILQGYLAHKKLTPLG